MIGVIFAGGYGSRLFPLTLNKPNAESRKKSIDEDCFNINAMPKPLAPVTNYPTIYSQLSKLRLLGAQKAIVTIGYMGYKFAEHIPRIDGLEIELTKHTGGELDTLVGLAENNIIQKSDQVFIVMGADIVSNIDPRPALDAHQRQRSLATVISTPLRGDEIKFSAIITEEQSIYEQVTAYQHKTTFQKTNANKRNASIYLFHYDFLGWLNNSFPHLSRISLSEDIFPRLAAEGKLFNYRTTDFWRDVGEIWDYLEIQYSSLGMEVEHPLVGRLYEKGQKYSNGKYTVLGPSLIAENCEIGTGSVVGPNTIIGAGWRIGNNSCLEGTVLWPDYIGDRGSCFFIGDRIHLRGCLVGSGAVKEAASKKVIVHNGEQTISQDLPEIGGGLGG